MPHRSRFTLALALTIAGIIAILVSNAFGLWWITMIVGFVIGLLVRGAVASLPAAALAAVLGWGLALAWQALFVPISSVATVVAGIMFGATNGALTIILTLILALLLSLAGAWAGAALCRLVLPSTAARL